MTDNFSSKEILIRLMSKMDSIETSLGKQELLLNTIHEASAGRDEKIKDLKIKVVELEAKVETLSEQVSALKGFNKMIVAVWSFVVFFVSVFGTYVVNRIF